MKNSEFDTSVPVLPKVGNFTYGKTEIKSSEHFSSSGKSLLEIIEDIVIYKAKNG